MTKNQERASAFILFYALIMGSCHELHAATPVNAIKAPQGLVSSPQKPAIQETEDSIEDVDCTAPVDSEDVEGCQAMEQGV